MNHSWDEFDPVKLIKQPIVCWLPYKSWKKKDVYLIIDHHETRGGLSSKTKSTSIWQVSDAIFWSYCTMKLYQQVILPNSPCVGGSKVEETAVKNVSLWEKFNNGQRNTKHPKCMLIFDWSSLINRLSMMLVWRPLSKIP